MSANRLIDPAKLGYSKIYMDFLNGQAPAVDFYLSRDLSAVASALDGVDFRRAELLSILHAQNTIYGVSAAAQANIDRLGDPRAVCVFSGQQAGLFGGPLLSLIKGLAAARAAELYSHELGRPVIPVFWIAGDDHDFEEVNHTGIVRRDGEICRIAYNAVPEKALPVSEIKLSDTDVLNQAKACLRECLGETDFTDELFALLDRTYTPEETIVTAFGKFMAALTADTGLVLFSPGDMRVKRHATAFFRMILERQEQMHRCLTTTKHRLEEAGYHVQVEKKDNASHLFYNLDGRMPVMRDGDGFTVGERTFSEKELLERIEDYPEKFSPDVLTRPVFQSYLFPVLSQKGGASELAYLAQLNPLFELFGLPAPVHRPRPSVTLIESHMDRQMENAGISFEDLTGDIERVINRVLTETFPSDLDSQLKSFRTTVADLFGRLGGDVIGFDPQLRNVTEQTSGKIDFIIKGFEHKIFTAHKKKYKEVTDRIYRLYNTLYPHRCLQERCLNVTYFLARHGLDVVNCLYRQLDSEETAHQLISLGECEQ